MIDSLVLVNHILLHYSENADLKPFKPEEQAKAKDSKVLCFSEESTTEVAPLGKGLLARRDLAKDELAALYSGQLYSYGQLQRDESLLDAVIKKEFDSYALSIGGEADDPILKLAEPGNFFSTRFLIDGRGPIAEAALGRYANHTCTNRIVTFTYLVSVQRRLKKWDPARIFPYADNLETLKQVLATEKITFFWTEKGLSAENLAALNEQYDRSEMETPFYIDVGNTKWHIFSLVAHGDAVDELERRERPLGEYALLLRYHNADIRMLPLTLCQRVFYDNKSGHFRRLDATSGFLFLNGMFTCLGYAVIAREKIASGVEIVVDYGVEYGNREDYNNWKPDESLEKYSFSDLGCPSSVAAGGEEEKNGVECGANIALFLDEKNERMMDYNFLIHFLLDSIDMIPRYALLESKIFTLQCTTQHKLSLWQRRYADLRLVAGVDSLYELMRTLNRLLEQNRIEATDAQRVRRRLLTCGYINYANFFKWKVRYADAVREEKAHLDKKVKAFLQQDEEGTLDSQNLYRLIAKAEEWHSEPVEKITYWLDFHCLLLVGSTNLIFRDVLYCRHRAGNDADDLFIESSLRGMSSGRIFDAGFRDQIFSRCGRIYRRIAGHLVVNGNRKSYRLRDLCESTDVLELHFVRSLYLFTERKQLKFFLLTLAFYKHLNLMLRLLPVLEPDEEWLILRYERNYRLFFYAHQVLIYAIDANLLDTDVGDFSDDLLCLPVDEEGNEQHRQRKRHLENWSRDPFDPVLRRYATVASIERFSDAMVAHLHDVDAQTLYNRFQFAPQLEESPLCLADEQNRKNGGWVDLSDDGKVLHRLVDDGRRIIARPETERGLRHVMKKLKAGEAEKEFSAYRALMEANLLGRFFLRPYKFCRASAKREYRLIYEKFDVTLKGGYKKADDDPPYVVIYHLMQVLQHAKRRVGLVHRDLKPDNVGIIELSANRRRFVIYDFGRSSVSDKNKNDKLDLVEEEAQSWRSLLRMLDINVFILDWSFTELLALIKESAESQGIEITPLLESDFEGFPHDPLDQDELFFSALQAYDEGDEPPHEIIIEEEVREESGFFKSMAHEKIIDLTQDDEDYGFFAFQRPLRSEGEPLYYQVRWKRDQDDTEERVRLHYDNLLLLGTHEEGLLPLVDVFRETGAYARITWSHNALLMSAVKWSVPRRYRKFQRVVALKDPTKLIQITVYAGTVDPLRREFNDEATVKTLVDILQLYARLRRDRGLFCRRFSHEDIGYHQLDPIGDDEKSRCLVILKLDECSVDARYKRHSQYILSEPRANPLLSTEVEGESPPLMNGDEVMTLRSLFDLFAFLRPPKWKENLAEVTLEQSRYYGDATFDLFLEPLTQEMRSASERIEAFDELLHKIYEISYSRTNRRRRRRRPKDEQGKQKRQKRNDFSLSSASQTDDDDESS